MNKTKKILFSISLIIVMILGICITSNAYDSVNNVSYVGQQIYMTRNEYLNSDNIFCLEHGQLSSLGGIYNVISNVRIEGTKSTDHTGKTIDNKYNARFAYILSKSNGLYGSNKIYGPVANAIWNFAYKWMENVGKYHVGLYSRFCRK